VFSSVLLRVISLALRKVLSHSPSNSISNSAQGALVLSQSL